MIFQDLVSDRRMLIFSGHIKAGKPPKETELPATHKLDIYKADFSSFVASATMF